MRFDNRGRVFVEHLVFHPRRATWSQRVATRIQAMFAVPGTVRPRAAHKYLLVFRSSLRTQQRVADHGIAVLRPWCSDHQRTKQALW